MKKTISLTVEIQINEQAYLLGISKNLWSKKFRGHINLTPLDTDRDNYDFIAGNDLYPSPTKIMDYLETAGQKMHGYIEGLLLR